MNDYWFYNNYKCCINLRLTRDIKIIVYLPIHVRKLNADWPHIGIGFSNLRYDVPLKYASFGSSASAVIVNAGIMTERLKRYCYLIDFFLIKWRRQAKNIRKNIWFADGLTNIQTKIRFVFVFFFVLQILKLKLKVMHTFVKFARDNYFSSIGTLYLALQYFCTFTYMIHVKEPNFFSYKTKIFFFLLKMIFFNLFSCEFYYKYATTLNIKLVKPLLFN